MKWHPLFYLVLFCAGLSSPGHGAEGAASVPEGQKLFIKGKCQKCHSVESAGIKFDKKKEAAEEGEAGEEEDKIKPPDLSGAGNQHDAAWIGRWITKQEVKDGKKHKTKYKGSKEETETLSAWLASLKKEAKPE